MILTFHSAALFDFIFQFGTLNSLHFEHHLSAVIQTDQILF